MTPTNDKVAVQRVGIVRPLIVFLVFAIVGPLVGGVLALAVLLVVMSTGPDGPLWTGGMDELEKAAVLFLKIVYFDGGLQAVFVGLVALIATILRWRDRIFFLAVAIASLIAGIAFVWATDPTAPAAAFSIIVGVHIATGIVCWLIALLALRLLRGRSPKAAST
jgi:hypothetical protein